MKKPAGEKVVDGEVLAVGNQQMRRRGGVLIPEERSEELFDGGDVGDMDILEPALQGVLTELGGADQDAKVSVYRWENLNGVKKSLFLYECHPNDFTMQDLQEAYGAGDYQIRVYGKQAGTNYKVIHANKKISIGPTREQARGLARPTQVSPALPAAGGGASDVARALAEVLGPVMASQGALLAKIANNEGGGRKAMLEEMELMSRMFRPQGEPQNPFGNIKPLLEIMQLLKGDGTSDPEAAPYALMGKAMDMFGEMYRTAKPEGAQRVSQRQIPAKIAANGAAPAAAGAAPGAQANEAGTDEVLTEEQEMSIFLKGQLVIFLNAAKMGASPETYGTLLYEQAPDDLLEKIQADNWFETLCQLAPDFSQHKEWAESVRAVVMEEIEASLTPEGETGKTAEHVAKTPTGSVAGAATGSVPGKPSA